MNGRPSPSDLVSVSSKRDSMRDRPFEKFDSSSFHRPPPCAPPHPVLSLSCSLARWPHRAGFHFNFLLPEHPNTGTGASA
eukprot:scaffold204082_cov15-Tisochrysis_lutea.AAC.1